MKNRILKILLLNIFFTSGIPQIFGTQVKEIKSGKFEFYKMRSMNNIDKLRASFNLGSLSKYLEGYGIKIEK